MSDQPTILQRLSAPGPDYAQACAELCTLISEGNYAAPGDESQRRVVAVLSTSPARAACHQSAGSGEFTIEMEIRCRPPGSDEEMIIEHRDNTSNLRSAAERATEVIDRFPGATVSLTIQRALLQVQGPSGLAIDEVNSWIEQMALDQTETISATTEHHSRDEDR